MELQARGRMLLSWLLMFYLSRSTSCSFVPASIQGRAALAYSHDCISATWWGTLDVSPHTAWAPQALLTDWHKAVGRPRTWANHRQRLLDEQATTTALALTSSYSHSFFQLSYEIKFIQAEKLEVNMNGCLLCNLQEGPFQYCIL